MSALVPVILSGGSGTRLWPLSRESHPKQFLPLLGGETSLLQSTWLRLQGLPGAESPLVVANEDHRFMVAEQLRGRGARIVLEPVGRNSAPAIAAAALLAEESGPDTVMWIMAADSAVTDLAALHAVLARAAAA